MGDLDKGSVYTMEANAADGSRAVSEEAYKLDAMAQASMVQVRNAELDRAAALSMSPMSMRML
jgi:hypothetical protein